MINKREERLRERKEEREKEMSIREMRNKQVTMREVLSRKKSVWRIKREIKNS